MPDYPITVNDNDSNSVNCNDNQHTSAGNEIFSIAPGEGKHSIHFVQDKKNLLSKYCFQEDALAIRLKEM